MSLNDVVRELIEVACGRKPVLTVAEADALHAVISEVEAKAQVTLDGPGVSQEPSGTPAAPDAPPAPENPADSFYGPQGNV